MYLVTFKIPIKLTLLIGLLGCVSHVETQLPITVIRDVNILTLNNEEILQRHTVVIKDSVVIDIASKSEHESYPDAIVIDGGNKFLMPALCDMHVHLPKSNNIRSHRNTLKLLLAHGITFARNMSGYYRNHDLLIELGREPIPYPKLVLGSPFFQGNGHFQSAAQLADSARSYALAGFDFFKVHSWLSAAEFDSLVGVAKSTNLFLEGHVPKSKGFGAAIATGRYRIIDHLDGFFQELSGAPTGVSVEEVGFYGELHINQVDMAKLPQLGIEILNRDIGIVPTQNLVRVWYQDISDSLLGNYDHIEYISPNYVVLWNTILNTQRGRLKDNQTVATSIVSARDSIIKTLHAMGVPILCGSGSYEVNIIPGFSLTDELIALNNAGLSKYEALQSATSRVADWYGLKQGRIEPGRPAELILLDKNPLEDLNTLRNITGLFTKNQWLARSQLDQMLKDVKDDLAPSRQRQ